MNKQQPVESVRELFNHLRLGLDLAEQLISKTLVTEKQNLVSPERDEPVVSRVETLGEEKLFFTVREVCDATGLSRSTVYKSFSTGQLRKTKFGCKTLVKHTDFEDWINGWDRN